MFHHLDMVLIYTENNALLLSAVSAPAVKPLAISVFWHYSTLALVCVQLSSVESVHILFEPF